MLCCVIPRCSLLQNQGCKSWVLAGKVHLTMRDDPVPAKRLLLCFIAWPDFATGAGAVPDCPYSVWRSTLLCNAGAPASALHDLPTAAAVPCRAE